MLAGILLLLFLASVVAVIAGLIRPRLFSRGARVPSRKMIWFGGGFVNTMLFMGFVAAAPKTKSDGLPMAAKAMEATDGVSTPTIVGSRPVRESGGPAETTPATTEQPAEKPVALAESNQSSAEPRQTAVATRAIPKSQLAFIDAVEKFKEPYRAAPNELKKSSLRRERAKAIRTALPSTAVSGWTGKLTSMGTTSEGQAYVSIKLDGSGVTLMTSNNALSDLASGHKTLISPDDALYDTIAKLSEGDSLIFSGKFIPATKDHVMEISLTEEGAMMDPEFLIRLVSAARKD